MDAFKVWKPGVEVFEEDPAQNVDGDEAEHEPNRLAEQQRQGEGQQERPDEKIDHRVGRQEKKTDKVRIDRLQFP